MIRRVKCYGKIQVDNVSCVAFIKPTGNQIEDSLRSIGEGGSHVALLLVGKVGTSGQMLLFDDSLHYFANTKREVDGPELSWACCAGGGCD